MAAYSTTRALYAAYNGPLYQVKRASDGTTTNIGLLSAGGDANAAAQDSFCAGTTCTITKIYDQSPNHSDLPIPGRPAGPARADIGANAMALPVMAAATRRTGSGAPGTGYRDDNINVPTGSQPEGVYMVAIGTHVNNECCFDFGNGETITPRHRQRPHERDRLGQRLLVRRVHRARAVGGGRPGKRHVQRQYRPNNASNHGNNNPFVTAWEKNNGTSNFTLKDGNAHAAA